MALVGMAEVQLHGAHSDRTIVSDDFRGTKRFEPQSRLLHTSVVADNGHRAQLEGVAKLDDNLAHAAVGCIQDYAVPRLRQQIAVR